MRTINPKDSDLKTVHGILLGAVAPRPIAFASTIDRDGRVNLSPFSFFNAFSANPPIVIFSPARSGRDNTTKNTFDNVKEVPEAVISIVNYSMVEQMSLASTAYEKGVNEFVKAGFTELASNLVRPPRVKESPVQMECKVREVIELGDTGGAGNLVVCEVLLMHIDESVLNENGTIDQRKIDLVGRMGGNFYVHASGDALFEIRKPIGVIGMGVDQLPEHIRTSGVLTGNELGKLGTLEALPTDSELTAFKSTEAIRTILEGYVDKKAQNDTLLSHARKLLTKNNISDAMKTLLIIS